MCYIISSMVHNITKHIKPLRPDGLPEDMRLELKEARDKRGWSQRELGSRLGLPQMHISGIESGKIVPRYDTLLELVRMLDRDLLMVPRALVPVVQSLIARSSAAGSAGRRRGTFPLRRRRRGEHAGAAQR